MVFSSPAILWGLLLLAVPVIIHLFQFKRYKKLLFPDVSLLKELQSKSSTKNQLRHLLVLFTRLLFIAFLVMAFAEPLLPPENNQSQDQPALVSIYLDNSFSMDAKSEKGRLFDQARALAYDIAATYTSSTRFQLITNELQARQRKALDFNGLLSLIDETEVSAFSQSLDRIQEFHQQTKSDLEISASVLYFLSDFSGNASETLELGDSLTDVRIIALEKQPTGNLSIDSIQIASPSIQEEMEVALKLTVTNHGASAVENAPMEVNINGENTCRMLLTIPAQTTIDTQCVVQTSGAGYYQGIASIEDFPVTYDNEYFFSLLVNNRISVVEVGDQEKDSPFNRLLDQGTFSYQSQSSGQINQGEISEARFLIFNEVSNWTSGLVSIVNEATDNGKTVLIIPPSDESADLSGLSAALGLNFSSVDTQRMEANQVNVEHTLYNEVFERIPENLNYPQANKHWSLSTNEASNESVIELINGTPLLGGFEKNSGKIYYTTVPLTDSYTNLHRHALFVPAVYNMAIQSGRLQPLAYRVGASKIELDLPFTENTFIRKKNDSLQFRPSIGFNELGLYGQLESSGFYEVNDGDSNLALTAFNYARSESSSEPLDEALIERLQSQPYVSALSTDSERIAQSIAQADVGTNLWPWFILLALSMAVLEMLLLKILKT